MDLTRISLVTIQNFLSRKLEVHLGPDTAGKSVSVGCMTPACPVPKSILLHAELEMRAGLHSGAVTAGVLRGVRSRFQLFGDTMNVRPKYSQTPDAATTF